MVGFEDLFEIIRDENVGGTRFVEVRSKPLPENVDYYSVLMKERNAKLSDEKTDDELLRKRREQREKWLAEREKRKAEAIEREKRREKRIAKKPYWKMIYDNDVISRLLLNLSCYFGHSKVSAGTKGIDNLNEIILHSGWSSCIIMMEYILLQNDISVTEGTVITNEQKGSDEHRRVDSAEFCMNNAGIIPDECRKFLMICRHYSEQLKHDHGKYDMTRKKMLVDEFVKTMDLFIAWFYKQYISSDEETDEILKNVILEIYKIADPASFIFNDEYNTRVLLDKLAEQTSVLKNLKEQIDGNIIALK